MEPMVLRRDDLPGDAASASRKSARRAMLATALLSVGALFSSCTVMSVMTHEPRASVGPVPMASVGPMPSASVGMIPPPQVQTTTVAAAAPQARGLERLVPSNPMMNEAPREDLSPREPGMVMPASEVECRQELRRLGVTYRDLEPINDGGACRIDFPVQVSGLSGDVRMKPAATLTCQMAAAFASWTRDQLAPTARWRYMSGVGTIHQGSSYSCRRIARTSTPSEHSKGNALDVMRIELKNGRDIDVRKPGWFAFRQRALLNNVRAGGCEYFTTVLGPGYNADHADHFHFDIKERRNGRVACH